MGCSICIPLKQGLRLYIVLGEPCWIMLFHLYSIKTRIKTRRSWVPYQPYTQFHLYSIKTRIKTQLSPTQRTSITSFHLYSIKTRIKTHTQHRCKMQPQCSICIPLKQGLRQYLYCTRDRIENVPFVFH